MFILVIIGIILSFPVAKGIQIVVPSTYGSLVTLLLGPGFIIAGIIFVIKDRKSPKVSQEIVSNQRKFCGKCGNGLSGKDTFCTKCGSESKG